MEGLPLPWDLNLECVEDGATLKVCKDSPVTVEEVAGRLARRRQTTALDCCLNVNYLSLRKSAIVELTSTRLETHLRNGSEPI